ncbi:CBS domain-containing protein [Methanobrevibacter filiformis]|uniref:Inosine 5'-monophosphate dehydrogenase n=1 Tax=Methanobrevibacter filiformis TaxID=55758 RepID=A0A165Z5F8_9EURY|nr:CBS domain-containing protein [Methanobrevibacter filiformis]KZX10271.1 inosine 5'-monophosphate dehydrogenase [Methanobrevibacter filiformis]
MLVKDIMTDKIVHVSVPGNREKALELMISKNVSGLPVVKEGSKKLVGIITRSDLIENPGEDQLALLMSRDLATTSLNEDVKIVAKKMLDNQVRRIPVLDDNEDLIGIVTASDLVSSAITEMNIEDPVENYMVRMIPTVWEKTPLNVAFEMMRSFNFKCLIALDDETKISGILTETDFINESEVVSETSVHNSTVGTEGDKWSWDSKSVLYVEKHMLKFSDKNVLDVSTNQVATANTKTRVSECAKRMYENKIEQIPIIGVDGELVGLIRANDLIKSLI